jgi:eukaryotic-like serine/threonine-protein kinase
MQRHPILAPSQPTSESIPLTDIVDTRLTVTLGQYSVAGKRSANEDACGVFLPEEPHLTTKGIAAVIADGMGSAEAPKEASQACVKGFLSDYFSTPESWSVKLSAHKVLMALNRWLYGQGYKQYGTARGMVTTLSALVIKSSTAYLFHVGDTRIYRQRENEFECLTQDHRVQVTENKNYLTRAMGIELNIEIDYRDVDVQIGDRFLLTTDGIHDFVGGGTLFEIMERYTENPQRTCEAIVAAATENNSDDNLSCLILQVHALPGPDSESVYRRLTELPFPPPLEAGMILDGYRILRTLYSTKRTELYLAVDQETDEKVVLKAPSVNYEDDPRYIDLFLHEEWVGKRVNNAHVLKVKEQKRRRQCLYYITEYVQGQSLRQWMHDNPNPSLVTVRTIAEQIAAGLRAFHRLEMVHQDLKPENIMIDDHGTVTIVDFGSTKIAGIDEIASPIERIRLLGTESYTAPEYHLGYKASNRSDIYSLAVIIYEMLTGKLPNKPIKQVSDLKRWSYQPVSEINEDVPLWVDGVLEKALQPDMTRRYEALSEFMYDLANPNPRFLHQKNLPLMERNPIAFWRTTSVLLLLSSLVLLALLLLKT